MMVDAVTQKLILEFVKRHRIGVLATMSKRNQPEAAVIEYSETPELEIVFDTLNTSRKYLNLLENQKVALVVGWDEDITVQYEGQAHELEGAELERCKALYFAKNPRAKKWENIEGNVYFKITPIWARYSDLSGEPWDVRETGF